MKERKGRSVEKKESERIGVQPVGIITLGKGESETHVLIDADHMDVFAAQTVDKPAATSVISDIGAEAHISLPELDPNKVTFVQIGHDAVSAQEIDGDVLEQSQVLFSMRGTDMTTNVGHSTEFSEEQFSHLFLEPKRDDLIDFAILKPAKGNADFLIVAHDPEDYEKATIFSIAEPAIAVEEGISVTAPKVDLLQFVQQVHDLVVASPRQDFEHLPEQDSLESAIKIALANGKLEIEGANGATKFEDFSRDAAIIGFVYRIKCQFALRGRKRYKNKAYYKDRLQKLAPFFEPPKRGFLRRKPDTSKSVSRDKWRKLLRKHSGNNISIHPKGETVTATNHQKWQTEWDKEISLDNVGRLTKMEQNDYVANQVLETLGHLKSIDLTGIDRKSHKLLLEKLSHLRSLMTNIHRQRAQSTSSMHETLQYADLVDFFSIGNFTAGNLLLFLNDDNFTFNISQKSRKHIVNHTLDKWEGNVLVFKQEGDFKPPKEPGDFYGFKQGWYGINLIEPTIHLEQSFKQLFKLQIEDPPSTYHPYYCAETIMLGKILFAYAAEYQQLKYSRAPQHKFHTWSTQLKRTLDSIHQKRAQV